MPPTRVKICGVTTPADAAFAVECGADAVGLNFYPKSPRYLTPDAAEAVRLVDAGDADAAFLPRATRIEDVFERARRGEVMPQKTTYFFPKLTSGLLFHPVGD